MVQGRSDRGEKNNGCLVACHVAPVCAHGGKAALQGRRHHHHPRATAERAIVHAPVVALGMVARIPQPHINQARAIGAARHAAGQKRAEQLGEQGDDVKAHAAQAR